MSAIFDTHSIVIRKFEPADIFPLHEAALESLPRLSRWMNWCPPDYSVDDARSFILKSARAWECGEHFNFAIRDACDDTFLGSVALNHLSSAHKIANVAYWVRSGWTGKGAATSAVRLAARFGLCELELNRLEFLIPTENRASLRVAQNAGAQFEGNLRSRIVVGGRCHDAAVYSLVGGDLPRKGIRQNEEACLPVGHGRSGTELLS